MKTIPIAFVFDDNFKLPAWVALRSLLTAAGAETFYEIFILYSRLNPENIEIFKQLSGPHGHVNFIKIDNSRFSQAPKSKSWPHEVYYRLIIPELLPQYDKVIYSDVDVVFKEDLSAVYDTDLTDFHIAAVPMETRNETNGIHQHFPEYKNDFVFISSFIIFNNKLINKENIVDKMFENMQLFEKRLKMFDLEILNLSCDKIKPLDIKYCVFENLYYQDFHQAPEYKFLKNVFSDNDLSLAIKHPAIIHYAGSIVKMWRKINPQPDYMAFIRQSPYYGEFARQKLYKIFLRLFNPLWWLLGRILPSKKYRKQFRKIYQGNF